MDSLVVAFGKEERQGMPRSQEEAFREMRLKQHRGASHFFPAFHALACRLLGDAILEGSSPSKNTDLLTLSGLLVPS